MRQGFLPAQLPPPRALAHRGLALEAPENSMVAFAAAVAEGADYLETDVHASRDGIAVVSHDPTLERTAGLDVEVRSFLWSELRDVDLGDDQTIPRLDDVLRAFPDTRFNIDLKSDDVVEPAVHAVRSAGAVDRVLLTSFDEGGRRRAAALLPGVATSACRSTVIRAIIASLLGSSALMRFVLRNVVALQVPLRHGPIKVLTPRMIRLVHKAGREVHVWTINDARVMHKLLDSGVDGIVTDRIDRALEVLRERRAHPSA